MCIMSYRSRVASACPPPVASARLPLPGRRRGHWSRARALLVATSAAAAVAAEAARSIDREAVADAEPPIADGPAEAPDEPVSECVTRLAEQRVVDRDNDAGMDRTDVVDHLGELEPRATHGCQQYVDALPLRWHSERVAGVQDCSADQVGEIRDRRDVRVHTCVRLPQRLHVEPGREEPVATPDPVQPLECRAVVRDLVDHCVRRPHLQVLSLIHISEPTRLGMISYAVFCLKKKKIQITNQIAHDQEQHLKFTQQTCTTNN